MELHISLNRQRDLSGQIYSQLRGAILNGLVRPGEAVPATRELARYLAVSRNTVTAAYDRLAAEGYLNGRVGVGTYVSDRIDVAPLAPATPAPPGPHPRPVWDDQPEPPPVESRPPAYDFRPGIPDAQAFPLASWRGLLAGAFRQHEIGSGEPGDPGGDERLRVAIARHVRVARGVAATSDQVLVTNGTQQALDLVGRVLLAPGDLVAVEDPGWPLVRRLFTTMGAQIVDVPVDAEGLVVDALPDRATLVCVSPSHQFPLGVTMSLSRRLALLRWAERTGAVIVEDDYDSEFRYAGRPLETLQSLDRRGVVVYLGSFSKTLLPTLRLGYCVSPPSLLPALRKAKRLTDWHTAGPLQAALAQFIDSGRFARHVRRMRRLYQDRRDQVGAIVSRDFAGRLEPISAAAGLHLAVRLRGGPQDDQLVAARGAQHGLGLLALSSLTVTGRTGPGLVLGYGAIAGERIPEGLRRLRDCLP